MGGDFLELCVDCRYTNDLKLNTDLLDFLGCPLARQRFPDPEGVMRGRVSKPFLDVRDNTTMDWLTWEGRYVLDQSSTTQAPVVVGDARNPILAGRDTDPRQVLSLVVDQLLSRERSRLLSKLKRVERPDAEG